VSGPRWMPAPTAVPLAGPVVDTWMALRTRRAPQAAGHEAAHAVIGAVSGLLVVTVATRAGVRDRLRKVIGSTDADGPPPGWPIPLSATAKVDMLAAGYAWDRRTDHPEPWAVSAGDRAQVDSMGQFLGAANRVGRALTADPRLVQAIEQVAARLNASETGRLSGDDVEQVLAKLGVIPPVPQRQELLSKVAAGRPVRGGWLVHPYRARGRRVWSAELYRGDWQLDSDLELVCRATGFPTREAAIWGVLAVAREEDADDAAAGSGEVLNQGPAGRAAVSAPPAIPRQSATLGAGGDLAGAPGSNVLITVGGLTNAMSRQSATAAHRGREGLPRRRRAPRHRADLACLSPADDPAPGRS
jgi:hypothetical protein